MFTRLVFSVTVILGCFFVLPAWSAKKPQPTDRAINVHPETDLNWAPEHSGTVSFKVYLGTHPAFLVFKAEVMLPPYNPGTLKPNTHYYWRIDEINDADPCSPYIGSVWEFRTRVMGPQVSTYEVDEQSITATSAILKAGIVDDGGENCKVRFHYWPEGGSEQTTPWQFDKQKNDIVSQLIEDLSPDTVYSYKAEAENSNRSDQGTVMTFKTLAVEAVTLTVSSTTGGSVAQPGEGSFFVAPYESILIRATPVDANFLFVNWSGTAVKAGIVVNPNSATTTLVMDFNTDYYTLVANFCTVLTTLYVGAADPNNPIERGTPDQPITGIQEAIDVALDETEIVVSAGVYEGGLVLGDKALSLVSQEPNDPNDTVRPMIVGDANEPAISFSGTAANCMLSGFDVTGGRTGIVCNGTSPVIANCIVSGNQGYGILCIDSNANIVNCTITGNFGDPGPGGDYYPDIDMVLANYGGGLYSHNSNVELTNSIVWNNQPESITVGAGAEPFARYCDIEGGWSGPGNRNVDPFFFDHGYWDDQGTPAEVSDDQWIEGDYHLMSTAGRWDPGSQDWVNDQIKSPCIDAGDPDWPIGDEPTPHGECINMGAYGGTNHASKSLTMLGIGIWDGEAGNGLWSDPLNWSSDTLPVSASEIIIEGDVGVIHLDMDFTVDGSIDLGSLSFSDNDTLVINSNVVLTINGGQHPIWISRSGTLINDGTIQSSQWGEIYNAGGILTNNEGGSIITGISVQSRSFGAVFTNDGIYSGLRLTVDGCIFNNNGLMNGGIIVTGEYNPCTINNNGTINTGSRIEIKHVEDIFNNYGALINTDEITNYGIFTNFGTLDNTGGTFTNLCSWGNAGVFINSGGTVIGNPIEERCKVWDNDAGNGLWSDPLNWSFDTLPVSTDEILIHGENGAPTTVHLDIDFTIEDELRIGSGFIESTLVIDSGVTLTNSGVINNQYQTVTNNGIFNNNGTFNNVGHLNLDLGPTVFNNHGTLINTDTFNNNDYAIFNNDGTIDNQGTIINTYDAIFNNNGIIIGNPVLISQ